ncbi:MAG: hypothetical protein A3H35_12640 [Betaproteobacteria bacterium RIFCSPLOWO2_02_FULL_62_17]|nr:MAG: hypothetical protein A3H35_12640 [Betaproteobacteria bacterium RIFCSPLOWO2_02_FULL_62_17]
MLRTLLLVIAAILAASAWAEVPQPAVDVYLFWRTGCPHCEREIAFLDRLAAGDSAVRVHKFEVSGDRSNAALMVRVAERLGTEAGSVPLTVIGDQVWIGYLDDATTGREIETGISQCRARACTDAVAALAAGGAAAPPAAVVRPGRPLPETITVPLVGEVNTASLSLPALTVLLAALDGFNPCAMWVLLFLLGLLAGLRDRTRMWVLGGAFVAASALTYLLVLAAWLNLLLLIGAIVWVRAAIGLAALAAGGYYLKRFFTEEQPVCEITAPAARRQTLGRLKELAQQRDFLLALGGIVVLAFAVNLVEFLCSAGIPAVFTQILALSSLSAWQYAAYLVLYVLVFMLDDLAVLAIALRTLEVSGFTTTYARWSGLAGGIVMVLIGALLILRPEWLSFA